MRYLLRVYCINFSGSMKQTSDVSGPIYHVLQTSLAVGGRDLYANLGIGTQVCEQSSSELPQILGPHYWRTYVSPLVYEL